MRLLQRDSSGQLRLTENFVGDNIPKYAILSHTWGADTDEVTLQDLMNGTGKDKSGYKKIHFCGEQASHDGLQYFWVDTCCIDKTNNAELSEAINSMFRWYRSSTKCYVYLSDVSTSNGSQSDPSLQLWQSAFRASRWFTRGWTLQELIAPPSVEFFCSNCTRLGDKRTLKRQLHEITGIALPALQLFEPSRFTVEDRMSWAKNRQTKREEDRAYCLLGIFDISMSLIYGEGAEKAFERLRSELYKRKKKHGLDEVSSVSHDPHSAKRSKISHGQPSSIHPSPNRNAANHNPAFYHEYSTDDLPAAEDELVTTIDASIKQSLIEQLYFTKIDERLTNLAAAQGSTCRWFFNKPEYTSWSDMSQQPHHGGFLWIKGNPGTGKSTLMKLLFEQAKLNAKADSSKITLSFFFHARGTTEEKSVTGLYRSLLHQLCEKGVDIGGSLEWMTADGAKVIQRNGWHEEALKQTLMHAIHGLGSRLLIIYVDALDECDKNQALGMVEFFEELCGRAVEVQARLQICFSSRHYPTIVIQRGIEVTLEDEVGHMEDIEQYIKSKLRLRKTKQAEQLRSEILEKSSRIFLWVVLVLEILNSECPDKSINDIRKRLKDIPPKLNDLFEMIVTRDGENLDRLQICLKWILLATRPLKPQELYFAVQLGLDEQYSTYWDQEDMELDQMKTFVRNSSKGLAEVTRNKASEVQFIHESVRDFLLGKYESQWSGTSTNFVGHSHELLRNCCLAQLKTPMVSNLSMDDELQLKETIRSKFPFIEYAVLNILHHANDAQHHGIEQGQFLALFPLQRWIFLNNEVEKFEIRKYTASASILYILAEMNLPELIRIHPQRHSSFEVENERYGPPIFAALATKSLDAARTLLEVLAETQPNERMLHDLCKLYFKENQNRAKFDRQFSFSQKKGIFSHIAEQRDWILLSFLSVAGNVNVKEKDNQNNRTLLSWMAETGLVDLVKLQLQNGAEPDARDRYGRTPLSWAAQNGKQAVVELLLAKDGVDPDFKDRRGQTPLLWAAQNGYTAVVELLLAKDGVDPDSKDNYDRTPLLWAAQQGHQAMVELLLAKDGVDPDSKDNIFGQTPLLWAAQNGHTAVVELLLAKDGVDPDSKDNNDRTPLLWAARKGHQAVVELLLTKDGVNPDSKDNSSRTPLSWAAGNGHTAIVELLLAKDGVDPDSKDNQYGRTPLSRAAENGHQAVVELLLAKDGVDPDSKSNSSRTPLSWAAWNGNTAIVELLLAKDGVDPDAKDNNGWTPLSWATYNGHRAVVALLRAKASMTANMPA